MDTELNQKKQRTRLGILAEDESFGICQYREGCQLVQNWVPIDLVDIFMQLGLNLFDRMNEQIEQGKLGNDFSLQYTL